MIGAFLVGCIVGATAIVGLALLRINPPEPDEHQRPDTWGRP